MEIPQAPSTIAQSLTWAQARGLDRLDAQLLVLHALGRAGFERAWLLAHDSDAMPNTALAALQAAVLRRTAGEPLAYITGHKEFYGLDLMVDARVLVPRPDTETLVDWALEVLANSPPVSADPATANDPPHHHVLDLGTGSGAIALALKHSRPVLVVSAVDFSADALAVAQANAQRLHLTVQFTQGNWLDSLARRFNLIASNPPYIAAQDPHLAALTHEPLQALTSGTDGLDAIRTIITQAPAHLLPHGWLLLEHGYDQAQAVRALLTQAGFADVQSRRDLAGIERCSGARLPRALAGPEV
jgi:release factor glutamine methyltransferase